MINKQIILKERPVGFPNDATWNLESKAIPELKEGEVLIQHHYISSVSYTHLTLPTKA